MEAIFNYITEPGTIITFIVFVFGLGATWSRLNGKIKELEKRLDKLDELDLDNRLTRMENNIDWIRSALEELKKLR